MRIFSTLMALFQLLAEVAGLRRLTRRGPLVSLSCLRAQARSDAAVLIVDHGSRKAEANSRLHTVVRSYKEYSALSIVEAAHMELAEPSISEAFRRCVEQGARHIICHPYFLSPGRHVQEDIPALMKEAASLFPGVTYTITSPLGSQDGILGLIDAAVKNEAQKE